MNIAKKIREIYEQRPYPATDKVSSRRLRWKLAPMEWIDAVWQPEKPSPARILVAGCGAGAEAFALGRHFPRAEIVAVDFSPRSIAVARDLQLRSKGMQNIRFIVGDLTSRKLARAAGRNFDFISCHGVLSYIPNPGRVLRRLAELLAADGALYLGVNGETHASTAWRKVLPGFGFEMDAFQDGPRLRKVLTLLDSLDGPDGILSAKQSPGYLAGDIFGPLIQNLPLSDWVQMARSAGLHFRGNYSSHVMLRSVINNGSYRELVPRSRAEVALLVDAIVPLGFHRAVFARSPEPSPPWDDANKLLDWRPVVAEALRRQRWPKSGSSWTKLRTMEIKSPATNTLIKLRVPEWELKILRESDGIRPLRSILADLVPRPRLSLLGEELCLLYYLALLTLLPPKKNIQERSCRRS